MLFVGIAAATHQGVPALMYKIAEELSKLPPIKTFEPEFVCPDIEDQKIQDIEITRICKDTFSVEADWIKRVMSSVNFSDYESRMYFERVLRKNDVYDKLEEFGVIEGDTIIIYDLEFEYVK